MNTSAALADPLFRQACGRRARLSVSRRGLAILRRTVMNNPG
ncbi:hypothetical protein [Nitrospira defluvii]|nr:hypothetical protein [Nitrospira defluvii]